MKNRLNFLLIIFILLFGMIIGRVVYIDFFSKNREKLAYAKADFTTFERGFIVDRNGNQIAVSIRQTSIALNPGRISTDRLKEYAVLCNLLNIEFSEFKLLVKKDSQFVWLKRKVDDLTIDKIKKLDLPGLQFLPEYKRYYPNQNLASHVLGCVGVDNYGLEGIELFFNNELKGDVSDMDFQKVESAKKSVYKIIEGKKIVLTIDKFIQHIVEKEIQKSYEILKPESISAIVMDPNNGDVLAMANMPDFDPNNVRLFSQGTLKNLCVSDFYEPGSIFKIISTGAMLNDNDFPLDKSYNCEGSIKIGNKKIKCWTAHKYIKYNNALKYSCNAAIISRAINLDPKYFYLFIRNLGFGSITGIELPGELKGLLRPPHQMSPFSMGSISIGQEIGVTPLQLITAISAFANGGNLYHPHIVKEIRYADDTVYRKFEPMVIRNCVPPTVTSIIRDLLLKVTEKGGTGEKASIPKYRIAGKTGTSQVFDMKANKYYREKHVLSFIGYYPAERPEIVILVIVRSPKNMVDATGGVVVAPIFHDIAMKINSYLDIIPVNNVVNGDLQASIPQKDKTDTKKAFNTDILPDLSGYNMKECIILVNGLELTPNFIGSGVAFKQYPIPGTKLNRKIPLTVWFK